MIKTKKQMFVVIGSFILILLLTTVTYAFFNYTRTGTANTIRTGQINFLTTQGNTINLTNVFPTSSSEVENNGVTLRIEGDTTYSGGEEFEITLTEVNNTIGSGNNARTIPINYVATYTPTSSGENIGSEAVSDYFSERGSTTTVYELTETGVAENGKQVLVGYIPANGEIDGTLTIKAYLDASNIVISDTYPSGTVRTVKTTGYSSSNCETALTGVTNASTYCASAEALQTAIDNGTLTSAQITLLVNAGIVEEYTNGTPASFGEGKTVLTTAEWNALQNTETPLSFKIRAESREGTWVEEPVVPGTIPTCPGCKFMYTNNTYQYGTNGSSLSEISSNNDQYFDDYNDVIDGTRTHFLGFTISNNKIDRAFICGVKQSNPNQGSAFCLEASEDNSTDDSNANILYSVYGQAVNDEYPGCYGYDNLMSCAEGENLGIDGTLWYDSSEGLGSDGYHACSINYDGNTGENANGFVNCW